MIKFFRLNDPLRYLTLFLFLFIIRGTFLFIDKDIYTTNFHYMLCGEKMNENLIYQDFEDTTPFLSALTFQAIDYAFGRSAIAYSVISLIIVFVQIILFNDLCNRFTLLNERNYIPGLLYFLISCYSFETISLSPIMMGTTFLLLSISQLFKIMKDGAEDEGVIAVALAAGIAFLFYSPFIIFFLMLLLSMLFYTTTRIRQYLLFTLSFFTPFLFVFLFYFIHKGSSYYLFNSLVYPFTLEENYYVTYNNFLKSFLVLSIIFGWATFIVFKDGHFVNFKVRCQSTLFYWSIAALISIFLTDEFSMISFYIFVPPVAYFISAWLIYVNKRWMQALFFYTLLGCAIYGSFEKSFSPELFSEIIVEQKEYEEKNQRILVLSNDLSPYLNNKVATRFLGWKLSKKYFENAHYLHPITAINESIVQDYPEAIYDYNHVFAPVLEHLPKLAAKYKKINKDKYILIK